MSNYINFDMLWSIRHAYSQLSVGTSGQTVITFGHIIENKYKCIHTLKCIHAVAKGEMSIKEV